MTVIESSESYVDVYRFQTYSGNTDQMTTSRRYATVDAIRTIAKGEVLYRTKISIDRRSIEPPNTDIEGMTNIGFQPTSSGGFPRKLQT